MVIAALLGQGDPGYIGLAGPVPTLPPRRLAILGYGDTDIDPRERHLLGLPNGKQVAADPVGAPVVARAHVEASATAILRGRGHSPTVVRERSTRRCADAIRPGIPETRNRPEAVIVDLADCRRRAATGDLAAAAGRAGESAYRRADRIAVGVLVAGVARGREHLFGPLVQH
jgi:hypothetical protein